MAFVVSSGQLVDLDRTPVSTARTVQLSDQVSFGYADIWRTQPQVRTVISFLARNIAQLPIHLYRRVSDTDRQRLTDHPLSSLLTAPNPSTTRYRLVDSLVHDLGIFDNAFWLKLRGTTTAPLGLLRLPPQQVTVLGDSAMLPATGYLLTGSRAKKVFTPDQVVHFRGHNPIDARVGASPIETLRRILAEEYMAAAYREQLWRNGARFGGYLRRPSDAPNWSDKARDRFRAEWQQQYTGDGPNSGGTPILEDGMEWVSGAGMTPEQAQYLEARKLTREEVAAAYHIPLPMVGILEHATFSNITEQHKQLYQDTLGPWLTMLCEDIELQLLPDLPDSGGVYVEFNMAEKLRGSFEEQAQQLQTAIGAPWLTRNEGRARMNLPAIDGGDDLVTPLNVLIGGQASPTDSAPVPGQNALAAGGGARAQRKGVDHHRRCFKARADASRVDQAQTLLGDYFARQKRAILAKLGAKAAIDDAYDDARWNAELADDLDGLAGPVTTEAARATLDKAGLGPDTYDTERTRAWLRKHSEGVATGINTRTRAEVEQALTQDDPKAAVRDLYDGVIAGRTGQIATTYVTALSGFATSEAIQQSGATASKTWVVTSSNPRSSHSAMSGETVGMGELFSNGARWPGDSTLPDDERANCSCDLDITVEG